MSAILGAAIAGGLIVAGAIMKSNAKSPAHLYEHEKLIHKANEIKPPIWEEEKARYEANSKSSNFNANVAIGVGLMVLAATVFN